MPREGAPTTVPPFGTYAAGMSALPLPLLLLLSAALAAPVNLGFESAGPDGVPTGWTRGVGAQTGGAPRSADVRLVPESRTGEAALRFVGAARDQRWPMVETGAFPVTPGESLRFGGWVRTEEIRRERNQYRNCNEIGRAHV